MRSRIFKWRPHVAEHATKLSTLQNKNRRLIQYRRVRGTSYVGMTKVRYKTPKSICVWNRTCFSLKTNAVDFDVRVGRRQLVGAKHIAHQRLWWTQLRRRRPEGFRCWAYRPSFSKYATIKRIAIFNTKPWWSVRFRDDCNRTTPGTINCAFLDYSFFQVFGYLIHQVSLEHGGRYGTARDQSDGCVAATGTITGDHS